jgi:polysaccharide biosynthesis protein PelG
VAGIGFLLRRLTAQDNYIAILRAYYHSAVAVGPWILIVVAMALVSLFTAEPVGAGEVGDFFAIILYNILFSFVFSAPFYMVCSHYVADYVVLKDPSAIPGIMITSSFLLLIPVLIAGIIFYAFFTTMSPFAVLLSIINLSLFSALWFLMLYLATIRDFRAITISWCVGIVVAVVCAIYIGRVYKSTGMLFGLNLGLTVLIAALMSNILAEFSYRFIKPKYLPFYFFHYNGLFWGGFLLFAGLWVDKIIMWTTPEAVLHGNGIWTYPTYDGARFLSYLSIIPALAFFILMIETNFYESYIQYLRNIESNAPLFLIEEERQTLVRQITENARVMLILQGIISFIVISAAGLIMKGLNIDFLQISIFRFGALGAFFAAMNLIIVMFFAYFDSQERMLVTTGLMFISNIILTLISKWLGFPYYGLGYCLSMMLTFFVSAILFARFLNRLQYHIFISNVVKRYKVRERLQYKIPKSGF